MLKHLQAVRQIAERQGRLTGQDVRLLRKHMEWSGQKLAEEIGCDVDDVARCEWNGGPLPANAEQSLRCRFLPVSRRWRTIVGTEI